MRLTRLRGARAVLGPWRTEGPGERRRIIREQGSCCAVTAIGSSGGKASRFNATPFPDAHLVSQFDGGGPLAIPARSPSCVGVTSQSSALDLHGHYDDLHRRDLTLPFRVETGLANVLRKEAVAELITQES